MDSTSRYAPNPKPQAFFLVGPTASGKSAVAQYIAEKQGQLIVSADSMNLYCGMDIGTAKPSDEEQALVEYAGIDIADPTGKFSVSAYLDAVRPAFQSVCNIIVTGGTGLYVKCLTEGFDDVPPENADLRIELEALDFQALEKRAKRDAGSLYEALTEDDRRNPRRLIRILERTTGRDGSPNRPHTGLWNSRPKPTIAGLWVEREELHRRIEKRVENMYAAGLLDEARELMKMELSSTAMQAIGYAEAFEVIRGKMTIDEAKEKTVIRTRQLAKRQMTWFRNQLKVEWIEASNFTSMEKLADAVLEAWEKTGPIHIQI